MKTLVRLCQSVGHLATTLEWLLELNVNHQGTTQILLPVKVETIDFAYEHLYAHRNADSAF